MRIGFTTTLPIEIILAAGHRPVDLNNVFITSPRTRELMGRAETEGYPRSLCSWIKGIYGAVREAHTVDAIVFVTEGDCSNTRAMMETFRYDPAVRIMTFAFPQDRDPGRLGQEMARLASELGTSLDAAEEVRCSLAAVRSRLRFLDDLTWRTGQVSGAENHTWLVSSSDFNGDPIRFDSELSAFLQDARKRKPSLPFVKVVCAGVPPVFSDLHDRLEERGLRAALNEIPRQFSMPYDCESLLEQYLRYTYPYDVHFRMDDLCAEADRRGAAGVIHYVQSFCHRGIEDVILRRRVNMPVLTLEGDAPGPMDARMLLRLDIFAEMLRQGASELP